MLKDNPIFSKFEKKKFEFFFLPENSARIWAATKKWSLEHIGVKKVLNEFLM